MFVNKDQEIPSTFYEYKQKIRDAIGADGEKKLGDYIDDFANMASLLNKRTLEKHLGKLSLILEEKLNNMGLVEIVDGSKKIKRKEGKPYIGNYKVLSKFFDSWAKQNGFNQGGSIFCIVKDEDNLPIERVKISLPPTTPTLVGAYLTPEIFRSILLKNAYIFKDLGADIEHGEFTHIIGLYTIVEENKIVNLLKHPLIEIYTKLGDLFYLPTKAYTKSVWDIVFDNSDKTMNMPEELHDAIKNSQNDLIASIINGREMKRSYYENDMNSTRMLALAKAQKKSGLLINKGIYFEDIYAPNLISVSYDGVFELCDYDLALSLCYPKPSINKNILLIEKLIALFDPTKIEDTEARTLANEIHESFLLNKKCLKVIEHQRIVRYLNDFLNDKNHPRYIAFLINEAKQLLVQHDSACLSNPAQESKDVEYHHLSLNIF